LAGEQKGEIMKKVNYHAIERYGWECPECTQYNEEDDDPSYSETVFCQNESCGAEFEVGNQE